MILSVRSERATERKFQGAKWPGNERSRERVGQGANRPVSYWPIRSGERIGPGAKRLGTIGPQCTQSHASSPGTGYVRQCLSLQKANKLILQCCLCLLRAKVSTSTSIVNDLLRFIYDNSFNIGLLVNLSR